ncbi:flagellar M-ring protein FliF [Bacillus mesophilus]|uniref:Flagellar M-ring protein n=1 Tax=Bacillus mesophilus TaxID=1808955 RepID=A0A6M0Q4Z6_9BACI|nr:flagellar basal-body MS-ring/collar protein FliF [Bacillus mesophilus]MBM7659366.1 flagellar M-ring protein FliF [Bacillus mesophilus]NEY70238.1 flagellar basal body M-ring protein FliF [Bacillus mesophilus]
MNEKMQSQLNSANKFWKNRSSGQKGMMIGSLLLFITIILVVSMVSSKVNFAPLYSNLSPAEVGEIKAQLDGRGIQSQIADNGTTILVPQEVVDTLKVELAAEGFPNSGSIDYSFFSQNAGFGMTDNEFNVLKLEAMQTELAGLIKGIDGVQDAKVMINLPQETVWMSEAGQEASASIVLNTKAGYRFEEQQIQALYNLVSKSVPSLPTSNIVITNQHFEYFDLQNENSNGSGNLDAATAFQTQYQIKQNVERDIQRQVQQMLGMMMGQDKVVVSVTADIDFTQENREEQLVTPVNPENMEGIAVSVERITETFTGDGAVEGGIDGTGETGIPNYATGGLVGGTGDYERFEERINNDVNRIRKEIVESPYKVRDLGIQVMVEPPTPGDADTLPQQSIDDIEQILNTIVRTSIAKQEGAPELTDEELEGKVAVSVQTFNGKVDFETPPAQMIPLWAYIAGGVLLVIIILLLVLLLRKKKKEKDQFEYAEPFQAVSVQDINDETENASDIIKKQLEKLAKDNPGDFAKLLRSWIAEE